MNKIYYAHVEVTDALYLPPGFLFSEFIPQKALISLKIPVLFGGAQSVIEDMTNIDAYIHNRSDSSIVKPNLGLKCAVQDVFQFPCAFIAYQHYQMFGRLESHIVATVSAAAQTGALRDCETF